MTDRTPLLMIPGPIELSPAVLAAAAAAPRSHVSPEVIAAFGRCLGGMRRVWRAPVGAVPLLVAGSGSLAMELAVWNCVGPGDRVLVVETGYFGARMATMLERRGATVARVVAPAGCAVAVDEVEAALSRASYRAVCCTHVDTSTGVRVDAEAISRAARAAGALAIVDGVCSIGGERLDMAACGADVVLTASQKALGAPPGLALAVFSSAALAARDRVPPPPLYLDLVSWSPIHEAYAAGRPSYFATPATSLVMALDAALAELDPEPAWARHATAAAGLRRAWAALGLVSLAEAPANTLAALRYPEGVGPELVAAIAARGVTVAGGLYPGLQSTYFRVGHMGWVTGRSDQLARTVAAIGVALREAGHRCDPDAAVAALSG